MSWKISLSKNPQFWFGITNPPFLDNIAERDRNDWPCNTEITRLIYWKKVAKVHFKEAELYCTSERTTPLKFSFLKNAPLGCIFSHRWTLLTRLVAWPWIFNKFLKYSSFPEDVAPSIAMKCYASEISWAQQQIFYLRMYKEQTKHTPTSEDFPRQISKCLQMQRFVCRCWLLLGC